MSGFEAVSREHGVSARVFSVARVTVETGGGRSGRKPLLPDRSKADLPAMPLPTPAASQTAGRAAGG